MLVAMWQPQIVCGLIDLVITGLFVPMSATEADVVTATLRLILLLAASPTLSLPGYQGARSRIIVFCLELLHPLPPAPFLQCISSNVQIQLAMLIVLAFQASSHDCRVEMLRCAQYTQWLSRLGVPLPWWLSFVNPELSTCLLTNWALFCRRRTREDRASLGTAWCTPGLILSKPSAGSYCRAATLYYNATVRYHGAGRYTCEL